VRTFSEALEFQLPEDDEELKMIYQDAVVMYLDAVRKAASKNPSGGADIADALSVCYWVVKPEHPLADPWPTEDLEHFSMQDAVVRVAPHPLATTPLEFIIWRALARISETRKEARNNHPKAPCWSP
jgi:hypothetical protein